MQKPSFSSAFSGKEVEILIWKAAISGFLALLI